jgi:D-glycero-alpha-D-manno-heptose-7-phosphate kinase
MLNSVLLRSSIGLAEGTRDIIRSRAPLRISFCGGGTDVPPYPERYGGCVLSCTIDKYAYVSARPRDASLPTRVHSADLDRIVEFSATEPGGLSTENRLAEAIIRRFGAVALDSYMHCDAPPGSGLGSSSAMLVALAAALARFQKLELTADDIAELALLVERQDLGIVGGMQDQYATTYGGFNFIEFTRDGVLVHPLRLTDETRDELHYHLILCYTGATRFSSNILEEQTNNVHHREDAVLDALSELKQLTIEMRKMLLRGKVNDFGALLDVAWNLKRRLASGISNPAIEEMYEGAKNAGALGGKILGAGGGGFLLVFAPFMRRQAVREALEAAKGRIVDFQFDDRGARTWTAESETWADY